MDGRIKGVYFLASDEVFDLAVAFLNSFRAYNPDLRLCMIPYNESVHELEKLRQRYDFTVYDDKAVCRACDDISLNFFKRKCGKFRKIAAWEGPFDEFVYIDIDTVVLSNLEFAFKFLSMYDFIAVDSDDKKLTEWVWKKSISGTNILTASQIAYAANTGFIVSKKGALSLECIKSRLKSALPLRPHMRLYCAEQPFLNYIIVTSGKRYTSLLVLYKKGDIPADCLGGWAGYPHRKIMGRHGNLNVYPRVIFMHWAGVWKPNALDRIFFRILKILRIREETDYPATRFFMPYKKLWEHYRFMESRA